MTSVLKAVAADAERSRRHAADGSADPDSDLYRLLETLPVIEQAKGMVMGYYGLDATSAYGVLRRLSSFTNVKLKIICADLVVAAGRPQDVPFEHLRRYLDRLSLSSGDPPAEKLPNGVPTTTASPEQML